ncbi:hypothetical protein [Mailhella massiliensis]|uniref:Uncharacterized protein n=1 Tax=Mailhella massiliensis TaxID=1903261 RepID=A0A921AUP0_9BACT|nr:hypothetical protein [Mailhella massiliensis]HJD96241.1 hypothetical protein [Mailhella massiliensis]
MSSFVTGQIIEARCTRCKDVTGHVVMACLDGMPVKVECRACGSVHKYVAPEAHARPKVEKTVSVKAGHNRVEAVDATVKAEKLAAAPRPTREQQQSARRSEENEQRWNSLVAGRAGIPAAYSMNGSFAVDSLVDHPVFGTGAVLELFPPDKMDVMFKDGVKRLRCVC